MADVTRTDYKADAPVLDKAKPTQPSRRKRAVMPTCEAPIDKETAGRLYRQSGYDLGTHPAHLIRRAHQRATFHFQQVMAGSDLTPTQFAVLATVLRYGEVSQNHLGRLTAMDPSTISLVVRKLLKMKLICRSASEADQRLALIDLTDHGVRFTLERLDRSVEVGQRLLSPLSPDEQAVFLDLLRRVASDDAALVT
jgi:MarR family transcriptional regulator, lower aerobic nicotinate degradation pathway regulator